MGKIKQTSFLWIVFTILFSCKVKSESKEIDNKNQKEENHNLLEGKWLAIKKNNNDYYYCTDSDKFIEINKNKIYDYTPVENSNFDIDHIKNIGNKTYLYLDKNEASYYTLSWIDKGKGIISCKLNDYDSNLFIAETKIKTIENKSCESKGQSCALSDSSNKYQFTLEGREYTNEKDQTYPISAWIIIKNQKTKKEQEKPNTNGKWRNPIDYPMLCLYAQGGGEKPWHGSFGEKIRDGSTDHSGTDLLAVPGTKVYACLKGKISRVYTSATMAGNVVVLEVTDRKTFNSLKRSYTPLYKNKGEILEKGFDSSKSIYLVFMHLSKFGKFKEGDIVEHDDIIGYTGVSGNSGKNFTTRNPHLHFEISNVGSKGGLKGKCNASVYFKFKSENDLSKEEREYQKSIKDKEWK